MTLILVLPPYNLLVLLQIIILKLLHFITAYKKLIIIFYLLTKPHLAYTVCYYIFRTPNNSFINIA